MIERIEDDIDKLIEVLPEDIRRWVSSVADRNRLIEIVLDLGREPEIRYMDDFILMEERLVSEGDIEEVVSKIGEFGEDNRAGISGTLHRISAIRSRSGKIIGLTLRVGRAVYGVIGPLKDVFEKTDGSVLLVGRPGVGKTTLLREASRVLADELRKRVVIVDTSNEIGGDGDIPHPGIGRARRMQVPRPDKQHDVMIEAVENHMPEVIVIDEIGRAEEVVAARTIAERGVRLIATAHGRTLENLIFNPTLADLVGGVHVVTLSDEEARRRGTPKTILERKAQPTFDVLIEIKDRGYYVIHWDVAASVDSILRGIPPKTEIRRVKEDGSVEIATSQPMPPDMNEEKREKATKGVSIYPFGISVGKLKEAIKSLNIRATVSHDLQHSDFVITLRSKLGKGFPVLRQAEKIGKDIVGVRSNTVRQIKSALMDYLGLTGADEEVKRILEKTRQAALMVLETGEPLEIEVHEELVGAQLEIIQSYGLVASVENGKLLIRYPDGGMNNGEG